MLKNKWLKFLVVYLGATALSLSQLKISPIQLDMDLSVEKFGWLMSVFTLSALFLALPGGTMISKYGAKKVGIIVFACLVLGNVLGALSVNDIGVTNYTLLLISRIIEGVSFSMINLIAMVFIGEWFDEGSSGVAIGIFGTFSAFASMFGYNLYLPIFQNFGLRSVWVSTAILAGIALLGLLFLVDDAREEATDGPQSTYKEVFSQKNTWLLSIAMFTMTFVLYTFIAYYPRILTEVFGLSIETANVNSGLFGLVGVPFGLIAGILVDKFKVIRANNNLINISNELWTFGPIADGVLAEIRLACKWGKKLRFFTYQDKLEGFKEITVDDLTFEAEVLNNVKSEQLISEIQDISKS